MGMHFQLNLVKIVYADIGPKPVLLLHRSSAEKYAALF